MKKKYFFFWGMTLPLINMRISIVGLEISIFMFFMFSYIMYTLIKVIKLGTVQNTKIDRYIYILFVGYLLSYFYAENSQLALKYVIEIFICFCSFKILVNSSYTNIELSSLVKGTLVTANIISIALIYRYIYVFKCNYIGLNWSYPTEMGKNSLAFVLLIAVSFFIMKMRQEKSLKIFLLNIPLLIAFIKVDSRGILVALIISYMILKLFEVKKNKRNIFKISIIIIVSIFVLVIISFLGIGALEDTTRGMIYKTAIEGIKENIIWGIGADNFKVYSMEILGKSFLTHNDYFQVLIEQGFIIFIIFIIFMQNVFKRAIIKVKQNKEISAFGFAVISLIIYFSFINAVDNIIFWVLVSVIFAYKGE